MGGLVGWIWLIVCRLRERVVPSSVHLAKVLSHKEISWDFWFGPSLGVMCHPSDSTLGLSIAEAKCHPKAAGLLSPGPHHLRIPPTVCANQPHVQTSPSPAITITRPNPRGNSKGPWRLLARASGLRPLVSVHIYSPLSVHAQGALPSTTCEAQGYRAPHRGRRFTRRTGLDFPHCLCQCHTGSHSCSILGFSHLPRS